MNTGELLTVDPQELQFPFELKKQISCSMQLGNKTSNHVAFKLPCTQKEAPPDMQCKDKFLLQSAVASGEFQGVSAKDITPEMFSKESGNQVEECRLRVSYVAPRQPPSPVREGSEEGTSPRASVSENGTITLDSSAVSRTYNEPQENTAEARSLISKLSEEKNFAIQHNKKLPQELELLKRESGRSRGGIPIMYVILFGLIGLLLGYLLKKM